MLFYLCRAVEEHIDEPVWKHDALAEGIRTGRIPTYPLAEAVAELGLDG